MRCELCARVTFAHRERVPFVPFSIGLVTMAFPFRPAVAALVPLADGMSPQTTSLPARTLAAITDKEVFPITAHLVENVKVLKDAPGGTVEEGAAALPAGTTDPVPGLRAPTLNQVFGAPQSRPLAAPFGAVASAQPTGGGISGRCEGGKGRVASAYLHRTAHSKLEFPG